MINQKEAKYFDNLLEWSFIVNGKNETLELLKLENGIVELMKSYNNAYVIFFEKFMDQFKDTREAFTHAIMIKTYYGIKKEEILKEQNKSLTSFFNSF